MTPGADDVRREGPAVGYDTFWGIDVCTEVDVDGEDEPLSSELVLLADVR
jgi:hypothetical protein